MQAIQNWCYTIFAGVLFSGIVLLLTPSERFRPLMQLLLGAFLLVCIFTWCGRANIQLEMNMEEAERYRQEIAGRIKYLSQEELEKTAEVYLSDYGIKPGEYQIYMETEENSDSAEGVYLLLRLPARVMDQSLTISRALGYQLGVDVRIETYGKDAG